MRKLANPAQFLIELEGRKEPEDRKMRFPKIIKRRRFESTIYGKSKNYHYYRVVYLVENVRFVIGVASLVIFRILIASLAMAGKKQSPL